MSFIEQDHHLIEEVNAGGLDLGDIIESHDDFEHVVRDITEMPSGSLVISVKVRGDVQEDGRDRHYNHYCRPGAPIRIVLL